jgi:hypothetical protein
VLIEAIAAVMILSPLASPRDEREMVALPPPPVSQVVSSDLGLDVPVVDTYTDCFGRTEVSHAGAELDACLPGTYFIGHNPGPFTPLMNAEVGTRMTFFDATGLPHDYRVVSVRSWMASWGPPPFTESDVTAQFQTCLTLDGTWDRILDVAPAA